MEDLIERLRKLADDIHGKHSGTSRWSPNNPTAELIWEAAAALAKSEETADRERANIWRWNREVFADLTTAQAVSATFEASLSQALARIEELEKALATADEQAVKVETLLVPHVEWEPGTIRICPMRDGPCPHGMSCKFVGDGYMGYPCKLGWYERPATPIDGGKGQ